MKVALAGALLLLAGLAEGAGAETTTAASCPLTGVVATMTEDCTALRLEYQTIVSACVQTLTIGAERRTGAPEQGNAHTSRARHLL